MAEGIDHELTRRYLDRRVDGRMVGLIERELAGAGSVLDVGCGSGLYGPALRRHVATVIGIDHDPVLCRQAEAGGAYDRVICAPVARLGDHLDRVDLVFCSEFVEHVPGPELRGTLDTLEAVAAAKLVLTVPNRLFPHAHLDPTHVLRYRLAGLLAQLNQSRRFAWSLHPLGFADHWRHRPWCRPLDAAARRFPVCSPTVLYLGHRAGGGIGTEGPAAPWRPAGGGGGTEDRDGPGPGAPGRPADPGGGR